MEYIEQASPWHEQDVLVVTAWRPELTCMCGWVYVQKSRHVLHNTTDRQPNERKEREKGGRDTNKKIKTHRVDWEPPERRFRPVHYVGKELPCTSFVATPIPLMCCRRVRLGSNLGRRRRRRRFSSSSSCNPMAKARPLPSPIVVWRNSSSSWWMLHKMRRKQTIFSFPPTLTPVSSIPMTNGWFKPYHRRSHTWGTILLVLKSTLLTQFSCCLQLVLCPTAAALRKAMREERMKIFSFSSPFVRLVSDGYIRRPMNEREKEGKKRQAHDLWRFDISSMLWPC